MSWLRIAAIALAALLANGAPAHAQWNSSWTQPGEPKARAHEAFRLAPGAVAAQLRLAPVDAQRIEAVKRENALASRKSLQVGIGRRLDAETAASGAALPWVPVAGGMAAHWEVTSPGARALRVAIEGVAARDVELRFAGSAAPQLVYGPFGAGDAHGPDALLWSPVLEGETATVEVFVRDAQAASHAALRIARVSHLIVSPADPKAQTLAKAASGSCEVDLVCRSATDAALAQAGKAVARMTFSETAGGGTFLCTGTLLNPKTPSPTPYFYGANHCIHTQESADTLTTHWFYDAPTCGAGTVSPSYVQLPGGATLLFANEDSDGLLLRLKATPPAGAVYSAWDAATLPLGAALTAIHHPAGDVKKVSLGTMAGFGPAAGLGPAGSFIVANWNSIATGVTEGGSSGSGIFTAAGSPASEYRLRGGLLGGPSSCTASSTDLHDYYSRFDQVYPYLAVYLDPSSTSCTYSLSPASASSAAAGSSGTIAVATQPGCPWSTTSTADWIVANASGSGSGTLGYTVAANASTGARSAAVRIANQSFSVAQSGDVATGTNVLANPGFESGSAPWMQSSTSQLPIISTGSPAHSGSGFAWLGGYTNGTDTLYQDVAIPADAAQVQLRFWYRIETQEASATAYDVMTVAVLDPSTGASLATLATLSNADATGGNYVPSAAYDLAAFKGRTVRLSFNAINDVSAITSFFVDDVSISVAVANHTALWWKKDESGWGLNVNQQGDVVFATLFTYDAGGNPLWLVMTDGRRQGGADTFSGALYRTTGPAFNANPFTPITASNLQEVGTMTIAFATADAATLTYSVNGSNVTKPIVRQVYGSRAASCLDTTADRSGLANYQDLWWNRSESGWGINLTHQDDVLFATLFTYAASGQGVWLVMSNGRRQPDGSYLGDLYIVTGASAFDAQPFVPVTASNFRRVGTMRLGFSSGTAGTLTYSYDGVTVVKAITRQEFWSPLPACSS